MGKKKKKEKKRKIEDNTQDVEMTPKYSLDTALHSAKKTETTLQSLMREVAEEKVLVKKKEEEKIRPQLSHESKSEIAEAYALEDVPIAERKHAQKRERIPIVSEPKEKAKDSELTEQESKPKPKIQVEVTTVPTPVAKNSTEPSKDVAPSPPAEKVPKIKKENIYLKLREFFEDLLGGYNARYERWENSISNILAIMRKMRKITKKNTEDLTISIQNLFGKIQAQLELFKVKRDEVEKVAEVDIESMSGELKRVMGLLELQVKEYQLKRETDELIHALKY
ncbi:MAG: hypothetical protein ACFFE4_05600 [Candidatus Thorarchaeota archaeon]